MSPRPEHEGVHSLVKPGERLEGRDRLEIDGDLLRQAVRRLMVDDLDVETGEMCDGLHGFAFVVMGGMLETRQRKPLEDSKLN